MESGTSIFYVTEDLKIRDRETIAFATADVPWEGTDFGMFNFAFFSWLMDAHPAVFGEIGPSRVVGNPAFASPASMSNIPGLSFPAHRNFGLDDLHEADEMLIALEYVDEFVAQSDVYPLGP